MKTLLYVTVVVSLFGAVVVGAAPAGANEHHDPESIIRWTEDWPTYIDPAVGTDFSDSMALVQLYDTLVFPSLDGSIQPHLAETWDVSDDGLTYTFHLREGVKFHNGDELTAEDVVFSADRLFDIGEGFAYLLRTTDEEGSNSDGEVSYGSRLRAVKSWGGSARDHSRSRSRDSQNPQVTISIPGDIVPTDTRGEDVFRAASSDDDEDSVSGVICQRCDIYTGLIGMNQDASGFPSLEKVNGARVSVIPIRVANVFFPQY